MKCHPEPHRTSSTHPPTNHSKTPFKGKSNTHRNNNESNPQAPQAPKHHPTTWTRRVKHPTPQNRLQTPHFTEITASRRLKKKSNPEASNHRISNEPPPSKVSSPTPFNERHPTRRSHPNTRQCPEPHRYPTATPTGIAMKHHPNRNRPPKSPNHKQKQAQTNTPRRNHPLTKQRNRHPEPLLPSRAQPRHPNRIQNEINSNATTHRQPNRNRTLPHTFN